MREERPRGTHWTNKAIQQAHSEPWRLASVLSFPFWYSAPGFANMFFCEQTFFFFFCSTDSKLRRWIIYSITKHYYRQTGYVLEINRKEARCTPSVSVKRWMRSICAIPGVISTPLTRSVSNHLHFKDLSFFILCIFKPRPAGKGKQGLS